MAQNIHKILKLFQEQQAYLCMYIFVYYVSDDLSNNFNCE